MHTLLTSQIIYWFAVAALVCGTVVYRRTQRFFVRPTEKDRGQMPSYGWWIVVVLVAICAVIFIVENVQTKK